MPTSPSPTPVSPSPTTTKSQSPQTWSDTPLAATHRGWPEWKTSDPLRRTREAWFAVAAEHLDPDGEHFDPFGDQMSSPWAGDLFTWREEGTIYQTFGQLGVLAERGDLDPLDGCRYLMPGPKASNGTESCSADRFVGPHGERARITRYQRLCSTWDPGGEGDDARPGPGSTYATCGDYRVAVALLRRDGRIGYVVVNGRGTADFNPFTRDAMAAAAADPRVTVTEAAFAVPSDPVVAAVLADHVPGSRPPREPYGERIDDGKPAGDPAPCGAHRRSAVGERDPVTQLHDVRRARSPLRGSGHREQQRCDQPGGGRRTSNRSRRWPEHRFPLPRHRDGSVPALRAQAFRRSR